MTKTLTSTALWALLGWLVSYGFGAAAGWATCALGLALMVVVSSLQLTRIARWVQNLDEPPPASVGPWNDVLAPVYRRLKKDKEQITELDRHVRAIMMAAEALPDGAITLDDAMNITWCNQTASQHTGVNPLQDKGHSIFNILRNPEFLQYARQREWPSAELLHVAHDGQERSVLVQLTRYGLGQFLLVTRDVTQMEKLETTRKDFVANVSHELRTPLTVLLGFLETLHDMPADSLSREQSTHFHSLMLEQAQRMQAIVADLLTLSTLESSPTADGEPVPVARLIKTALQQAKVLSGGQHVFVTNIDEGLAIQGIETELASAVSNLLTNAVRYTPKDGTITISWFQTEQGFACYSVQDTGIGVAAQDIPRLTERFYRVDRGRSRATGGTGLGLAITKHIAMRHNAELTIQSRVGSGSVFSLVFPHTRVVHENTLSEH
jgi:two-component system phosphate regulon sensor histidine kinase PhoR